MLWKILGKTNKCQMIFLYIKKIDKIRKNDKEKGI